MEKNNDWGQAFEIWYRDNPNLDPEAIREVYGLGTKREMAKEIFYSSYNEFQRWLITSGFQEFVNTQCDQESDIDGYATGPSERENTLEALESLWKWMKRNEKELN